MKDKKIRLVQVYQAVKFEGSNETSFISSGSQRKKPIKISINHNYHGVEIESENEDGDHIFVPFTNVSCIYFESANTKKHDKKMKEERKRVAEINNDKVDKSKKPR